MMAASNPEAATAAPGSPPSRPPIAGARLLLFVPRAPAARRARASWRSAPARAATRSDDDDASLAALPRRYAVRRPRRAGHAAARGDALEGACSRRRRGTSRPRADLARLARAPRAQPAPLLHAAEHAELACRRGAAAPRWRRGAARAHAASRGVDPAGACVADCRPLASSPLPWSQNVALLLYAWFERDL